MAENSRDAVRIAAELKNRLPARSQLDILISANVREKYLLPETTETPQPDGKSLPNKDGRKP